MEEYNPNEHPLLTVVTSSINPLGKKFPKEEKYNPGVLLSGSFDVIYVYSMLNLYQNIEILSKFQVILLGIPKNGFTQGLIFFYKE